MTSDPDGAAMSREFPFGLTERHRVSHWWAKNVRWDVEEEKLKLVTEREGFDAMLIDINNEREETVLGSLKEQGIMSRQSPTEWYTDPQEQIVDPLRPPRTAPSPKTVQASVFNDRFEESPNYREPALLSTERQLEQLRVRLGDL